MKKLICVLMGIVLLLGLSVPVFADVASYYNIPVYMTDDSEFIIGGRVCVDKDQMLNDGNIYSEQYNALLEGRVQFFWYCNGTYYSEGESLTLSSVNVDDEIYCVAEFYNDYACTDLFGILFSDIYIVAGSSTIQLTPGTHYTESITEDGLIAVIPLNPEAVGDWGEEYTTQIVIPDQVTITQDPLKIESYVDLPQLVGPVEGPTVMTASPGFGGGGLSIVGALLGIIGLLGGGVLGVIGLIAIVAGALLVTAAVVILIIVIVKKKKKNAAK